MGNVVELVRQQSDVVDASDAKTDDFDALGRRVDWIMEAIEKQKAEVAQFRAHMDRLRDEMSTLDTSVTRYRERVNSIHHKRLQRQAHNLAAMLETWSPEQS